MAADQQNRRVITSFMLRFVHETGPQSGLTGPTSSDQAGTLVTPPNWRGLIKHIQSGAEQHFATLAEAETFIKRYIEE